MFACGWRQWGSGITGETDGQWRRRVAAGASDVFALWCAYFDEDESRLLDHGVCRQGRRGRHVSTLMRGGPAERVLYCSLTEQLWLSMKTGGSDVRGLTEWSLCHYFGQAEM